MHTLPASGHVRSRPRLDRTARLAGGMLGFSALVALAVWGVHSGYNGGNAVPARARPAHVADDPAIRDLVAWTRADGHQVLIVPAPSGQALRFYDRSDGRPMRTPGLSVVRAPRFEGIHALARVGNLLFVAESGPSRVRVLQLPQLRTRASLPLPQAPVDMRVERVGAALYRLDVQLKAGASSAPRITQIDWREHPSLVARH